MQHMTLVEMKQHLDSGASLLLDLRAAADFAQGFVPGSISLPYEAQANKSMQTVIPSDISLILILPPNLGASDAIAYTEKSGLTRVLGILDGGYQSWAAQGNAADMVITIEPDELAMDLPHDDALIPVDVRSLSEFEEGHLADAFHLPLYDMGDPAGIAMLPEQANLYLYCSNGNRSMTAASLLKRHGMHNLRVVMATWELISAQDGIRISKDASRLN